MLLDLTRASLPAILVGVLPGWFWVKCLLFTTGRAERLTYSVALSMALVPAVTLALARLLGGGVTLPIAVVSPLVVLGAGVVAYFRFGGAKAPDEPLSTPPGPPGTLALVPIVLALALVVGVNLQNLRLFWLARSCWGWHTEACVVSGAAQRFMLPVALLLLMAGIVHLLASRRELGPQVRLPEREPSENQRSLAVVVARRLLLPTVLLLVLLRGYLGPVLHDWPYIRGLDHYSHTVMTNLIMSEGKIDPYLIYPPGFHTLTAMISRLSGLDPLEIFPVLGPALLLLPALSCYVLGRRLWGWEYGVAAAFFSGVLTGGTYYYFNDAMYPNLVASQFSLVLAIAVLIELYRSASVRNGLLLALLGSSVVFYHQVASLYLTLLLALVAAYFLPDLLARERRTGLTLLSSLALLGCLSVLYTWDTYNLPQLVSNLVAKPGVSDAGVAVGTVIGTQAPYHFDYMIGAIVSQPVAWLGFLGAVLLVAESREWTRAPQVLVKFNLLLWVLLLFVGSRTPLSGFPQRFGRDLGVPLALLAALAFVTVLRSLLKQRKPAGFVVASLAVALAATLVGLRAAQSFEQAAGPSPHLTMTPEIAAAGEWLGEHNNGGNIIVSPHATQVPSRMMLAMGDYTALQSFEAWQIDNPRDLPPTGPEPLRDVLWVVNHPEGELTQQLLVKHDVRYVILYKSMPDRPTADYWKLFKARPELYEVAFENEEVLIVAPQIDFRHP